MATTKNNYYNTHPKYKESHQKRMTEKITCKTCGKEFMRSNLTNHNRTNYHIKAVKMTTMSNTTNLTKKRQKIIEEYDKKLKECNNEIILLIKQREKALTKIEQSCSRDKESSEEKPKKKKQKRRSSDSND
jgi:hypothetical protein